MKGHTTEHAEQCAFFEYVRYKALSDERYSCITAVPNAGKRSPQWGARMVREGLSKGTPDTMILVPSNGYHGLIIEFKIKPNKLTKEQAQWIDRLNKNGYCATVAWSATEAISILEKYFHPCRT